MDIDTLAVRLKAIEDKLALYEPLLVAMMPAYQEHLKEELKTVKSERQELYLELETLGITATTGNARCAPVTGQESADELRSMIEAAKLGAEEQVEREKAEAEQAETLRVENERVAKEAADKAEADRVEAERVAAEAQAASEAQAANVKQAETAEASAVLTGSTTTGPETVVALTGSTDASASTGVTASTAEPVPAEPTSQVPTAPEPAPDGIKAVEEAAAGGPLQVDQPVEPPTVVEAEHPAAAAARDNGRETFIEVAMREAGMTEQEAQWAWDHPPVRSAD